MKIQPKRIHGRLLMITGIVHVLLVVMPGVFGEQFYQFAKDLFFNINSGLLDFPLFGGNINNQDFAAFWFFYAGPLMFMYGHLLDSYEKKDGHIEKSISIIFIVISLIGSYMIPLSGMTFLLLPQGIYMYIRSSKLTKTANNNEERDNLP